MYYVCECGVFFNEDQDGARDHILEEHLDLVESRFDEFIEEAEADTQDDRSEGDIYDEAIDDVQEELLDAIDEYEA
jgi:hypothetical protein